MARAWLGVSMLLLLALPAPAAAQADDGVQGAAESPADLPGATDAPATGAADAGGSRSLGPVRPILLVGLGAVGGGVSLGGDAGLRVGPVTARFAWRGQFLDSGDYLTSPSGRIGWIFLERRWIAAHAGVGAGRVTRTYDDATRRSVSAPAAVAEIGALVAPAWGPGPLFAVQLETLVPFGRRDPPGGSLSAPALSATVSVNVLALLFRSTPLPGGGPP